MNLSSTLAPMKAWKTDTKIPFCLGADVGASGARFRFTNFFDPTKFIELNKIPLSSASDFYGAIDTIRKEIKDNLPEAICRGAAYAIAGLRGKGSVCLNNWMGHDRTIYHSKINTFLSPINHSLIINDLEAGAYGIVSSSKQGNYSSYFKKLFGPENSSLISTTANTAILGMGSGLGAALITNNKATNSPIVVSTEMGYLQIPTSGVNNQTHLLDDAIVRFASNHYYQGVYSPGFEDLASGRGLIVDYLFFGGKPNVDSTEISELAKGGDTSAKMAMKQHYLYFTRCAKQFAVTMKCGSILMALVNQVKNKWIIEEIAEEMEQEFKRYSRPELVNEVSLYTQIKECNFNLIGASYMAHLAANGCTHL
ncbi:Glucokinase 1 [Histomonas meleagridis]|uniref:Glucokinase 1 n=1 Tax=Histomonas meleagridis TaxID=135588 RepID=UPI00355A814E|nr:Glucokinase 1 [Histomonas meleagridis]KAH0798797.1 Glucokinase 1 [Histomonas meleagridis]